MELTHLGSETTHIYINDAKNHEKNPKDQRPP